MAGHRPGHPQINKGRPKGRLFLKVRLRGSTMRDLKNPLNWALAALAIVSISAILLGHENPVFRIAVCAHVRCPQLANFHAWEKIAFDLSVGSLTSIFFYWLVVWIPEHAKRRRIRNSFARHFREFKEDAIATMLMVSDGTFMWGLHRELVDQKKFREYFEQQVSPDQDRWDAVHNKMTEYYLDEILTHLEILRAEISFAMATIEINDERALEFLKRLSATIIRMRKTTLDYDSMKGFGNFLWEVFAGFSAVTGYQERDFFDDMIQAI
jgi:hypothetical protein